jgi:uncharacterized membrane protein YagU involved in acid resistance
MRQRSGPRAVLIGGSVAGTLDLAFAISFAHFNGAPPQRLLQTVASGLLGEASYSGGAAAAALGFALHFFISFLFASAYVLASRRIEWLTRNALAGGAVFGIGVFLTMRLVVLPISAFPQPVSLLTLGSVLDLLSHMFLFGLPIAFAAQKAAPNKVLQAAYDDARA